VLNLHFQKNQYKFFFSFSFTLARDKSISLPFLKNESNNYHCLSNGRIFKGGEGVCFESNKRFNQIRQYISLSELKKKYIQS